MRVVALEAELDDGLVLLHHQADGLLHGPAEEGPDLLLLRHAEVLELAARVLPDPLRKLAHGLRVQAVGLEVERLQRRVHPKRGRELYALGLHEVRVREREGLDVRVRLHGLHELRGDPGLDVGRGHVHVVEVEVRQRWVVEVRPVHHPDHPVAVLLRPRGLREELRHVRHRLDLRREVLVDGAGHVLAPQGLHDLHGELRLGRARGVLRGDAVRDLLLGDVDRRAADHAGLRVQLEALGKRRLCCEGAAHARIQQRLDQHRLARGVAVARHGVRDLGGRRQSYGEGDLLGCLPSLVGCRDHVRRLCSLGCRDAADFTCRPVEPQALGQRRLHGELRGAAANLCGHVDLLARVEHRLQGGVLQRAGRRPLDGEGQRRSGRARRVLGRDLVRRLLSHSGGRAADHACRLVQLKPLGQLRSHCESHHLAPEARLQGQRFEQRVLLPQGSEDKCLGRSQFHGKCQLARGLAHRVGGRDRPGALLHCLGQDSADGARGRVQ
mmetsp:Transcript_77517/g.250813  ORF Transcript_77517/g.250813 Transcript_77517/m.250813 type:complete len:497 (-) Transcript_77517:1444-2934(-)